MKTKLFSFVGIGAYKLCAYEWGKKYSKETLFAQVALTELLQLSGVDLDEVVIFATEAAKEKYEILLGEELELFKPKVDYRFVSLADKVTADKIWEFFDEIYKEIDDEDCIFFDITHGFRSFPLAVVPILQYARELKRIEIGGIFYGNYEARWEEGNKQVAPMDDLSDLLSFLDWSYGINTFLSTGNAQKLVELAGKEDLRRTKLSGQPSFQSKDMAQTLQNFNRYSETCRAPLLIDQAQNVKNTLSEAIQNLSNYQTPLANLFNKLEQKMSVFVGDPIADPFYSIKWCIEHGLTQQAYTMLFEHVITTICLLLDANAKDFDTREAVRGGIAVTISKKPEEEWIFNGDDAKELMMQTKSILESFDGLIANMQSLRKFRNDINHAGFNKEPSKVGTIEKEIEELALNLEPFFQHAQEVLGHQKQKLQAKGGE